jgi:hypothetical protein
MSRSGVLDRECVEALGAAGLSSSEKHALIDRIVATPAFSKSERLVSFLRHVCRMEDEGRAGEIGEQQIGAAVFGRSKNYDPSIDGIVRSHASRLRIRLDQYFEQEGREEPVRVSIPRGGYVPVYEAHAAEFRSAATRTAAELASLEIRPLEVEAQPNKRKPRWWWVAAIALLAGAAGSLLPVSRLAVLVGVHSPSDLLWRSVFVPGRTTTLVVGDGGVNMFENMARRQVTAEEYSTRSWLNEPLARTPPGYSWAPIAARTYTPWFVVAFATRLARLPGVADGQLKVASAREITLDTLKNEQTIVIGGPEYDPWEQLLTRQQNFHVVYDGVENSVSILNAKPKPGELPVYTWRQTDTVSHAGYSLISLGKNLNGNGQILELEGSTAQGDSAAAEFLLDPSKMDPVLRKALRPDGRLADFEMVLQTNFVAGGNFDSRVVAFRVHP